MGIKQKISFILLVLISIVGCGRADVDNPPSSQNQDDSSQSEVKAQTVYQNAIGTYRLPCIDYGDGTSLDEIVTIAQTNIMVTTNIYYTSDSCAPPVSLSMTTGEANVNILDFAAVTNGQGIKLAQQIQSFAVAFFYPSDIDYANNNFLCGLTNWELGVSRELAGEDCTNFGMGVIPSNVTHYSIISLINSGTQSKICLNSDWSTDENEILTDPSEDLSLCFIKE